MGSQQYFEEIKEAGQREPGLVGEQVYSWEQTPDGLAFAARVRAEHAERVALATPATGELAVRKVLGAE